MRNTADMIRSLYEFVFIHFKTMKLTQPPVSMKGMKKEELKSKELLRRLPRTSVSHMENLREDAKDVYFGLLGYDIETYTNIRRKYLQRCGTNVMERSTVEMIATKKTKRRVSRPVRHCL